MTLSLVLLGCAAGEPGTWPLPTAATAAAPSLVVEPAEVDLVQRATCRGPRVGPCTLTWGPAQGPRRTVAVDGGTALLFGDPAGSVVQVTASWTDEAGASVELAAEVELPPAPAWMPARTVTQVSPEAGDEWLLFAMGTTTIDADFDSVVVLIDRDGGLLWYQRSKAGAAATQVRLAADGRSLVYNQQAVRLVEDLGELVAVDWAGDEVWRAAVPWTHHDFDLAPDGTVLAVASDLREVAELGTVAGDQVVKVDPVAGTVTSLVSTWDLFPFVDPGGENGFYAEGVVDWTHANAVRQDPVTGGFLFSLVRMATVLSLDAGGGLLEAWGPESAWEPDDAAFDTQHGFMRGQDGALLGVNIPVSPPRPHVEVVRLEPQEGGWIRTWQQVPAPDIRPASGGGAHELPSGNVLVAWGSAGVVQELAPSGEVLWEIRVGGDSPETVFDAWPVSRDVAGQGVP